MTSTKQISLSPGEIPVLQFHTGGGSNFTQFKEAICTACTMEYGIIANFMNSNLPDLQLQYFVPAEVGPIPEAALQGDLKKLFQQKYINDLTAREQKISLMDDLKPRIFAHIITFVSEESKNRAKEDAEWTNIDQSNDPLELWKLLRRTHYTGALGLAVLDKKRARSEYQQLKQGVSETIQSFKSRFDRSVKTIVDIGMTAIGEPDLAVDFIAALDSARYAQFRAQLQNSVTSGALQAYPDTLAKAYSVACQHCVVDTGGSIVSASVFFTHDNPKLSNNDNSPRVKKSGQAPTTTSKQVSSRLPDKPCVCGGRHWRSDCKLLQSEEFKDLARRFNETEQVTLTKHTVHCLDPNLFETCFNITDSNTLNSNSSNIVLLDNQATASIFNSASLLDDISNTHERSFRGISKLGGGVKVNKQGRFLDLGQVFFSPNAATNVLSWSQMQSRGFDLSYDKSTCCFKLNSATTELTFSNHNGLFICDVSQLKQTSKYQNVALNKVALRSAPANTAQLTHGSLKPASPKMASDTRQQSWQPRRRPPANRNSRRDELNLAQTNSGGKISWNVHVARKRVSPKPPDRIHNNM